MIRSEVNFGNQGLIFFAPIIGLPNRALLQQPPAEKCSKKTQPYC